MKSHRKTAAFVFNYLILIYPIVKWDLPQVCDEKPAARGDSLEATSEKLLLFFCTGQDS